MLDVLAALVAGAGRPQTFAPHDLRVAAAALLVGVIHADHEVTATERERLLAMLMERFALVPADARRLLDAAERRDREALDPDEFTTVLNRALDEASRRELVAAMWDLARADGRITEVEESAIWRSARLLGVLDPRSFAQEAMRTQDEAGKE